MSALLVAHPGRAAAYGAEELKRAAHKFGFFALVISVVMHFSLLGSYYLVAGDEPAHLDGRRVVIPFPGPSDPPFVPGIIELPAPARPAEPRIAFDEGTPVPVPDDPGSKERTIPTQGDRAENVDPHGILLPGVDSPVPSGNAVDIDADPIFENVEVRPRVVTAVKPVYPPIALKAGLEGRVVVKIRVDRQGKVRQVLIHESEYDIFNEAALEAARQFVFTPGYMNSGPVSVWVSVPFWFRITGAK